MLAAIRLCRKRIAFAPCASFLGSLNKVEYISDYKKLNCSMLKILPGRQTNRVTTSLLLKLLMGYFRISEKNVKKNENREKGMFFRIKISYHGVFLKRDCLSYVENWIKWGGAFFLVKSFCQLTSTNYFILENNIR